MVICTLLDITQFLINLISTLNAASGATMANVNARTFIMVKPDGVQRGFVGDIIKRFEQKGFKLVALKFMQASEDLIKQLYAEQAYKPFFPERVKHMISGPVVPMVWEGLNVVTSGRVMIGKKIPTNSLPGTIRGDFGIDIKRNVCHGSKSVEEANKDIKLFFTEEELLSWKPVTIDWVYGEN